MAKFNSEEAAMNLDLSFACLARGECNREFFCINPNFCLPGHPPSICPHLVVWDPTAKKLKAEGIEFIKEGIDG